MISARVASIMVSLTIIFGLCMIVLGCILEKYKTEECKKKANIALVIGVISLMIGFTFLYIATAAVRNPDMKVKNTTETSEELNIDKVGHAEIYLENGTHFNYGDKHYNVEIRLNDEDNSFKVVKNTKSHLLDYFVESYRYEYKYIVYVDAETKELMDILVNSRPDLLWERN